MGRGKSIRPPLTDEQELEAVAILVAFKELFDYAGAHRYLEQRAIEQVESCDGEYQDAHREEAALAARKREDALAHVLDVLRGRPDVRTRLSRVMLHGTIEDAVDSIERLRTPWRRSVRAHALRANDREALPGDIQKIQALRGQPVQTKRRIRAHLKDALGDPPVAFGRRGGRLTDAAAILAELVDLSSRHIERIVGSRRCREFADHE